ncbi:MAG: hypothetical protein OXH90_03680 [Paracoccaceae bacterium]|nr:hypothetical protein [Paracoccaceae bacterium]MDE2916931.1 hypothetical protein [Paracoccaceae bacterium]
MAFREKVWNTVTSFFEHEGEVFSMSENMAQENGLDKVSIARKNLL